MVTSCAPDGFHVVGLSVGEVHSYDKHLGGAADGELGVVREADAGVLHAVCGRVSDEIHHLTWISG